MSSETPQQNEPAVLLNQLFEVDELHLNVSQQVIVTTEDKIRVCLSNGNIRD
jgi:hypothetical protein